LRETASSPIGRRPTLEGVLERIVFFNEENSFTVARLQVPGRHDLVTIVGALSLPTPGETLRLRGQWVVDTKFGEQFRVESCLSVLPATIVGIKKYLGSGLVKGIGPIMARRIVDRFGMETPLTSSKIARKGCRRRMASDRLGPSELPGHGSSRRRSGKSWSSFKVMK